MNFLGFFFLGFVCFSGALIAQATSDFCRFMATRTSRQEHHQSNCWADLWATTKVVEWSNSIHKERMMMANASYHRLLPPNSLPSLGQIFLWVSALSLLTKSWNSPADGFCLSTTTWNKKLKRESCNIVEYSRVNCWLHYVLHSLWNTKVLTLVGFHNLFSEIGTLQSAKFLIEIWLELLQMLTKWSHCGNGKNPSVISATKHTPSWIQSDVQELRWGYGVTGCSLWCQEVVSD